MINPDASPAPIFFDFDKVPEEVIPNFHGGDGNYRVRTQMDGTTKVMIGRLEPGCSIGQHKHEGTMETICVIEGQLEATLDGKTEIIGPSDHHVCPDGHTHGVRCHGDHAAEFFAIVQQAPQK